MDYDFKPIATDDKSLEQIAELLQITFPKSKKFNFEFIDWQYSKNPSGQIFGYNAYFGDQLAAHYALMPIKARVFGKEKLGLLSLNTATHPNHRGKRLFPNLAAKSYDDAKQNGFGFIIGVANAQSTSGFIKKLHFQFLGQLNAKIGFGDVYKHEKSGNLDFQFIWNDKTLRWRINNPSINYKLLKNKTIVAPTGIMGINAILYNSNSNLELNSKSSLLNLWIGKNDNILWNKSLYVEIPQKLRPSPLNLIFKNLEGDELNFNKIKFDAIDFDAY